MCRETEKQDKNANEHQVELSHQDSIFRRGKGRFYVVVHNAGYAEQHLKSQKRWTQQGRNNLEVRLGTGTAAV